MIEGNTIESHANLNINLWDNFSVLKDDYMKSLDTIAVFTAKYQKIPDDPMEIRKMIDEIDRGFNNSKDILTTLGYHELALLAFIELAKNDRQKTYDNMIPEARWLASDACRDAHTDVIMAKLQQTIQQFISDTDLIYSQIMESRKARQNLINYSFVAIRSTLEDTYTKKVTGDLADSAERIEMTLRLARLSSEFENWYDKITYDPIRGKIESIYMQFEESRRFFAADLVTAQSYKSQIEAVGKDFPGLARPYIERIENVTKHLKDKLNNLETRGWASYLASQRAMTGRRLAHPGSLSTDCLAKLQHYLDVSQSITTIDDYRITESLYVGSVMTCAKKEK
jgi:hypothetical protein